MSTSIETLKSTLKDLYPQFERVKSQYENQVPELELQIARLKNRILAAEDKVGQVIRKIENHPETPDEAKVQIDMNGEEPEIDIVDASEGNESSEG